MIAVAVIGITAANAVQVGARLTQHGAEQELLAIGEEFQLALRRYAAATPQGAARAPASMEELLRDPRYPGVVRHLRRYRADPLTGRLDWTLVRDGTGRIVGIHSSSSRRPLKVTGFPPAVRHLEGEKSSYREWVFWGAVPPR